MQPSKEWIGLWVEGVRRGGGALEIAHKYQRPGKALPRPHLLADLGMADSRAGGAVMFDVISMNGEVPGS